MSVNNIDEEHNTKSKKHPGVESVKLHILLEYLDCEIGGQGLENSELQNFQGFSFQTISFKCRVFNHIYKIKGNKFFKIVTRSAVGGKEYSTIFRILA